MSQMTPLLLIAAGAVLHAWWNYLVKRSGSDDVMFVWCYGIVSLPLLAMALVGWLLHDGSLGPAWWAGVVSMMLHTSYAVVLQKAYARADMSVVYPVSRGLAPVLVTLASLAWAASPTRWGWTAMVLVIAGSACVGGGEASPGGRGAVWGVLVAAVTASYTLWDAFAAEVLHVAVIPYMALSGAGQSLLLTGVLWRRRGEFGSRLRSDGLRALPISLLAPLSYALVILALQSGTPSMVSTARSLNVAVGSLFAILFLRERPSRTSWLGIGLICCGAIVSAF